MLTPQRAICRCDEEFGRTVTGSSRLTVWLSQAAKGDWLPVCGPHHGQEATALHKQAEDTTAVSTPSHRIDLARLETYRDNPT